MGKIMTADSTDIVRPYMEDWNIEIYKMVLDRSYESTNLSLHYHA